MSLFSEILHQAIALGGVQGGSDATSTDGSNGSASAEPQPTESTEVEKEESEDDGYEKARKYLRSQFDPQEEDDSDEDDDYDSEDEEVDSKKEAKEKDDKSPKKEAKTDDEEVEKKKPKRLDKRLKGLLDERKTWRTEREQLQKQFDEYRHQQAQQLHQYQQQETQRRSEIEKQYAVMAERFETLSKSSKDHEEASLDPVEKFRRQMMRESQEQARKEYEGKFGQIENKYNQLVEHLQHERKMRESQERMATFSTQADIATRANLAGVNDPKLVERTRMFLLNWAGANNVLPKEAAKDVDRWAHEYVFARMDARRARDKNKIEKSKSAPKKVPGGRAPTKGPGKMPSLKEVHAMGFKDMFQYMSSIKGQ